MTSVQPSDDYVDEFTLDAKDLTKSTINAARLAFGISGVVALILGIILLVWPDKTLQVVAIIIGINFIIIGIVRLAFGIFTRGVSGGLRILNILLGILLLVAGVVAIKNSEVAGEALLILIVAIIGIGWIIEGVLAIVESGASASRGWAIAFGIITILAGIVVLAVPGWSAAALLWVTAIALVVLGIVGIVRAFSFGRDALKQLA